MIEIDIANYTPFRALIGGFFIGAAVILYFISTGRIAGVSGIVDNVLIKAQNRLSNLLFLGGLVLGPLIYSLIVQNNIPFTMTSSFPLIIIGGLFVGIGTKIGSGCTSGHGGCGISRFSIRSIIATISFILLAMITVFVLKLLELT